MLPEPLLRWKSIPFVERPVTTFFALSVLLLMAVILYNITVISWSSPLLYYLSMLILILNLLPYFIMTQYSFFEDRIEIKYLLIRISRNYSDFGCFYKDKYGVMLSTFKMPRRLDPFRGQSIRFSKTKEEMEELLTLLNRKIGKQY